MLRKTLSRDEVLEIVIMMAAQNIPDGMEGEITAEWIDDDGVEVFFVPKVEEQDLN